MMKRSITPQPKTRVLLLVETSKTFGCKIIEGICRYAKENKDWMLILEDRGLDELEPMVMRNIPCDGIISRTTTQTMFDSLRRSKVPVVELLGDGDENPADITNDRMKAGEMAFEHLRECQLRHFGFFSFGHCWWSRELLDGFRRQCQKNSYPCHVCVTEKTPNTLSLAIHATPEEETVVGRWLLNVPKPIGILCPEDGHAIFLLNLCGDFGLTVPFDVAVLGLGNNPILCNVTSPPLSSIMLNCSAIGYMAAERLDKKMNLEKHREETRKIPPLYVAARHSTIYTAVVDDDLRFALQFIKNNLASRHTLEQVAARVGLSKRSLIRRFQAVFGHPPIHEIMLIRLNRAKELLAETDWTVDLIAANVGYRSSTHFVRVFRRYVGVTPHEFRKRSRGS